MRKICHTCPWWTQIRGVNSNTGKEVDEWACAISMLPMLLVETANQAREGGAATESFRNEFVRVITAQMIENRTTARTISATLPKLITDTPG
jgi:hypothetical protein